MNGDQNDKMRWILFWIFIGFYIVITILTILALFFGLGSLAEEYKKTLFTTFIIETGVGVTVLFYALFGLKKGADDTNRPIQNIESDEIRDVNVVDDLPYKGKINLNESINLLDSYSDNFQSFLDNNDFRNHFKPSMYMFVSPDEKYELFRPNLVIQIGKNELTEFNITLADYMENVFSESSKMLSIVGKRYIRLGTNSATQWYKASAVKIMGVDTTSEITFQQVQKVVVSDDLMGIITISYNEDTSPKDQMILQQLIENFGI